VAIVSAFSLLAVGWVGTMPNKDDTRKAIATVRKFVKAENCIGYGISCAAVELVVMAATRRIVQSFSLAEKVAAAGGVLPARVTADVAKAEFHKPSSVAGIPTVSKCKHAGSRGCDNYMKVHRSDIKLAASRVVAEGSESHTLEVKKVMDKILWTRWSKLSDTEKQPYMPDPATLGTPSKRKAEEADPTPPKVKASRGRVQSMARLGTAMCKVVQQGTPSKEVRQLFAVAADEAGLSSAARNQLVPKSSNFQRAFAKLGRPAGSQVMADTELRAELLKVCQPTCRWSYKSKDVKFKVVGSKKFIFGKLGSALKCSFRTAYRLMRQGRLGVGPSSRRTDSCDVCLSYDNHLRPNINKVLNYLFCSLRGSIQSYFDGAPTQMTEVATSFYLHELVAFVKNHRVRFPLDRSALSVPQSEELLALEDTLVQWLADLTIDLESHEFHWKLKQCMYDAFELQKNQPTPNYTYVLWDHQDTTLELLGKPQSITVSSSFCDLSPLANMRFVCCFCDLARSLT
jgi:hypothetical protein